MSTAKISVLPLMMLLMVAAPVVASADSVEKIRFDALSSGSCFMVYGQGEEGSSDPFPPLEDIWYSGPGRGSARIRGYAKDVDSCPSGLFGEGYDSKSIRSWGLVSVSWIENKGTLEEEKHWILAMLYSTTTTYGFFIPDKLFSVPIPGVPASSEFLRITGMHVSSSETLIHLEPNITTGWCNTSEK